MGALDVVCADRALVSIGTQQRLSPIATSTGLSYLLTGLAPNTKLSDDLSGDLSNLAVARD